MAKYNYRKINFAAQSILVNYCNLKFPVNTLGIINQFPNIELLTYKEFDEDPMNTQFKAHTISKDAFTMSLGDNEYLIVYNNNTEILIPQRIRFSLAHEIGHISLGHFNYGEALLTRGHFGINSQKYKLFENEANLFANNLLSPSYLISSNWEPDTVAKIFDVSSSTAKISCDVRNNYGWIVPEPEFQEVFNSTIWNNTKNFFGEKARNQSSYQTLERIFTIKYYHYCPICKSLDINYEHQLNYCTICGSNELEIVTHDNYFQFHETNEQLVEFYIQGDNENMKYKALALDDEGRLAEECPNCKNEELKGNHCSICGKYIINRCTGIHEENPNWHQEQCEGTLSGADRYCYDCGAKSSFLENGFLPSWDEVTEDLPY